ncbi:hypothetical protein TGAMA5MH_10813 [Trichoderma gamsii]|uniref:Uncharacterized protein n=1 Tax=Trichoderma gamsii TaxID=398673 RepID=A0A2K0SVF7_9HYPO|nr:hypothetical protein TGAMA5MH_10813 [Trichoderma gamsii]
MSFKNDLGPQPHDGPPTKYQPLVPAHSGFWHDKEEHITPQVAQTQSARPSVQPAICKPFTGH